MTKTVVKKKRFKLRDPATGLYWGVSSAERPRFNKQGKHWGNIKAVMRNWADYRYHRAIQKYDPSKLKSYDDSVTGPYPENLELVEFEVVETMKTALKSVAPDMEAAGRLEAKHHRSYAAVKYVRTLAEQDKHPLYVVHCKGDDIEPPENFHGHCEIHVHQSWSSNTKIEDDLLLACFTEKDMIYVKMALHEFIESIWDLRSGERIYHSEK